MARIIEACSDKSFNGNGQKLLYDFLSVSSQSIFDKLFKFGSLSYLDDDKDNVFWYSERQVKGQIASALDEVCKGYFMMEPPVKRKKVNRDKKMKKGWSDFWCRFGEKKSTDILIEVKHSWGRYKKEQEGGEVFFYKRSSEKHDYAVRQLHDIEMKDYIADFLYAAALSVVPIFLKHKSDNDRPEYIVNTKLKKLCKDAQVKFGAHFAYIIRPPTKIRKNIYVHKKNNGDSFYESYPAVILLWSVIQIHRNKR